MARLAAIEDPRASLGKFGLQLCAALLCRLAVPATKSLHAHARLGAAAMVVVFDTGASTLSVRRRLAKVRQSTRRREECAGATPDHKSPQTARVCDWPATCERDGMLTVFVMISRISFAMGHIMRV